ncbi:trypsin-like peptidase domain-containing protein [Schaalia cardiffensis]|uniref:trypsin-like peptidase domain-containing protein n=1 Tax=Schaalia cardiffensis TaxID=181487 RepID=UPI0023EFFCC4|nr:trypsin-like peptidase domain-containing protein [Schaalia cardiffensis]
MTTTPQSDPLNAHRGSSSNPQKNEDAETMHLPVTPEREGAGRDTQQTSVFSTPSPWTRGNAHTQEAAASTVPMPRAGASRGAQAPSQGALSGAQAPSLGAPRAAQASSGPRHGMPGQAGHSARTGQAPFPGPSAQTKPLSPTPSTPASTSAADFASAQPWSTSPQGPGAPSGPKTSEEASPFSPRSGRSSEKRKKGPSWLALFLAMLMTSALTLGGSWALFNGKPHATPHASTSTQSEGPSTVQPVSTTGDSPDWAAVARAVSPATVTISVSSNSSSGVGSGVIYDAQGDIVTNYHVISAALDGQGRITVTLADGRMYEGEILGHDQTTDLAVVRLKNPPSDLTVATFGSSKDLSVGDEVMAVGAPLGLSNTVTTGIISALNRPVEVSTEKSESEQLDPNDPLNPNDPFNQLPGVPNPQAASSESVITNAIQVDASINPGNSGGPLFDSSGRVIGINSSIASNSSSSDKAGSIGLGFAIPVDLVTSVAEQIIQTGTVEHAVLGVSVTTGQTQVDGSTVAGAEVAEVSRGGAAEAAGLRKGDVILAVNGESVSSSKQLTGYIRRYKSGDSVEITYVREGVKYDVTTTLKAKQQ